MLNKTLVNINSVLNFLAAKEKKESVAYFTDLFIEEGKISYFWKSFFLEEVESKIIWSVDPISHQHNELCLQQ